jgi:hypothetical protein
VGTTVAEATLDQTATVIAYKQLSTAERAFPFRQSRHPNG